MQRQVARAALMGLGCSPAAIDAQQEPSGAMWLLAARFARDYEAALFHPQEFQDWPDWFMLPANRSRPPSVFMGEAENDRKVLANWLEYARKRAPMIERRLLSWLLAESLAGVKQAKRIRRAATFDKA